MQKLLLIILFALNSSTSYACSCRGYEIDEAFNEYEYVFVGVVKSFGFKWPWSNSYNNPIEVNFEITHSYKQNLDEELTIYTNSQSSACGYPFSKNAKYIVFANIADKNDEKYNFGKEGKPMVSGCSPTIDFQNKSEFYEKERSKILKFLESKNGT